ncbi:MAG: hypothetical protein JSW00_07165, partial [Thermoplasmata archaeon]
ELKKYVSGLDAEQENIFNDNFSRYRWGKIHHKLGLNDLKFHDLRNTFGSVLAQNGYLQLSYKHYWSILHQN